MLLKLTPFPAPFHGTIIVPGSKSITNRVLPLAALTSGKTRLLGVLKSEDTEVMIDSLEKLGVTIETGKQEGANYSELVLHGASGRFSQTGLLELDCQNSGTSLRFLTALSVLRKGETVLTGTERMKERPLHELLSALRDLGIKIECLEQEGFPPIRAQGNGSFKGGTVSISGDTSSQFITALLLMAPFAKESLIIKITGSLVSRPYVEMTVRLLQEFGVPVVVNQDFTEISVENRHACSLQIPSEFIIEGDASSATYPLAIAAITGGNIIVQNSCSNSLQGDAEFAKVVLRKMGCDIQTSDKGTEVQGPEKLQPLGEIDLGNMPDAAMTAVVLAAYAKGRSKITGLSTFQHKESDRIHALVSNLQKMGVGVTSDNDFIEVQGDPDALHGAEIETFNDHRIAMCFSVLGSVVPGVNIKDPKCVEKTYPTYWEEYEVWREG